MAILKDQAWTWGYVIPKSVKGMGEVPYVGKSWCSMETAANYIGTPNVVFMNSMHDEKTLVADYLDPIAQCGQVLCGLHADNSAKSYAGSYAKSARQVGKMSKKYPNITGGLIDDFLEFHNRKKVISPEETKTVYEGLKSENPALRLYVTRYTWQDQHELMPYLPYFDVINLWVWVANTHDWQVKMNEFEIDKIKRLTGKPVLLGLFMHDFGRLTCQATEGPVPMDVLELQFKTAARMADSGMIEGFVVLQSGFFDREDHRPQVQWIKQYLEWAFNTRR